MQTFYMTVGLPGCGKSNLVSLLKRVDVISPAALRRELRGAADNTQYLFDTINYRILTALEKGRNVVYDATNLQHKRRRDLVQNIKRRFPTLQKVCLFFAVPFEECCRQNENKPSSLPQERMDYMYRNIDIPMYSEGWDEIRFAVTPQQSWKRNTAETLGNLIDFPQDSRYHTTTLGNHLLATHAELLRRKPDASPVLEAAALLHDIGKPFTKAFTDSEGNRLPFAHYYDHERVGAYDSFFYTSHLTPEEQLRVALYIRWHMFPFKLERTERTDELVNRLVSVAGEDGYRDLMLLHECDLAAH